MPEPTVQDVMARPAFSKLSPGAQYQALVGVSPKLDKVSEEARPLVLKGLKDKYGVRTKGGLEEKLPTEVPDIIRREAQFYDAATNRGIQTTGKLAEWAMSPAHTPGTDQKPGPTAQAIHKAMSDPERFPQATTTAGKQGEVAQEGLMWAAPLPELGKGPKAIATLDRALRSGAHGAYEMGGRELLATGDPKKATIAAATGAAVPAVFEALRNPLSKALVKASRAAYAKVLNPQGGKVKDIARRVLLNETERDIVGRGVIAKDADDLERIAAEKTKEYSNLLNQRYQELAPISTGTGAHGPDYRIPLRQIYDDVFQTLGEHGVFKEDGTIKDRDFLDESIKKLTEITEKLGPELGSATPSKLREFRQSLEKSLYKPNAFKVTVRSVEGPKDEFTDAMANSIRESLNKDKTIGALNREYHFWETAREIMQARNLKEVGMPPAWQRHGYTIGRTLALGALGGGYGSHEGAKQDKAWMGAALGVAGGMALTAALETTAIRSVGAVAMDRFAQMLATPGSEKAAAGFLARQVSKYVEDAEEAEKLNKLGRNAVDEWRADNAAKAAAEQADKDAAQATKDKAKADKLKKDQADMKARQDKADAADKAKKDATRAKEDADAKKKADKAQADAKTAEEKRVAKEKSDQEKAQRDKERKEKDDKDAYYKDRRDKRAQETHEKRMAGGPSRAPKDASPATRPPVAAGGPIPDIKNYKGKNGIAEYMKDKSEWERLNPKGGTAGAAPAPAPSSPESPQGKGGATLPTPGTARPDATGTETELDPGATRGGSETQASDAPGAGTQPEDFGRETEVLIPGEDQTIRARYRIRDLSEVKGSHNHETFKPTEGYPYQNERDYDVDVNKTRVLHQGSEEHFRHEYHITDNPDATNGPMVTDENGYTVSGSGRRIQLGMIHGREGGVARKKYLEGLKKQAENFGINFEKAAAGKANPVLVREVSHEDMAALPEGHKWAIRKTNIPGTATLSPGERAIADAGQMTQPLTERIGGLLDAAGPDASINEALDGPEGPDLINRLIHEGFFSEQERNQLMDTVTGRPTKYAKERISNAMLGKFFTNSAHIDNVQASLRNKLERIAAPALRTAGGGEWDLMPRIREAIEFRDYMNVKGFKRLGQIYENPPLISSGPALPEYTAKTEEMDRVLSTMNPNDLARSAKLYAQRFKEYQESQIPRLYELEEKVLTQQEAFDEAFGATVTTPAGLPGPATSLPEPAPTAGGTAPKPDASDKGPLKGKRLKGPTTPRP